MTELMLTILGVWLVFMFTGVPIWLTLALAGAAFIYFAGINPISITQRMARAADSFTLVAAPMFILMGLIMNSSGVTTRIFRFAVVCVGWWKGGLCQANILGSVIFAGMSGSAVADAGGIGTIEIRAMTDNGYDIDTAAAITAASATIGPILPPSMPMIIYAVSAETSIGALFLAGVIPGLLMALALMIMVRIVAIRRNMPALPFPTIREVWESFRGAFWALMAPVVLFSGMLSGYFTPTEAAAVAAIYALIVGFGYRDLRIKDLPKLILEAVETNGVLMALIMASTLLAYCLAISQVPQLFAASVAGMIDDQLLYIALVLVVLLVVGMIMEPTSAMLILIPVLVPPALLLGIDPIHFGLVFVFALMVSTLTPPVGMVLFVIAKVAGISYERVTRATLPYLVPLFVVLLLSAAIPQLSTWLPGVMGF